MRKRQEKTRPTRAAFQTALLQLQNAEGVMDDDPEDDKRRLQIEFMHGSRLHTPMALCKPFTKFANLTNDTVVATFSQLLSALRGVIEGKFPAHKLVQGVLLHSKKGCAVQKFHRDYPYSACSLRRASPSYGVIYFPDGGTLEVVPGSHKAEIDSPKRTVHVPPHKLLVFHEGLAHAGSQYATANTRVHFFLENRRQRDLCSSIKMRRPDHVPTRPRKGDWVKVIAGPPNLNDAPKLVVQDSGGTDPTQRPFVLKGAHTRFRANQLQVVHHETRRRDKNVLTQKEREGLHNRGYTVLSMPRSVRAPDLTVLQLDSLPASQFYIFNTRTPEKPQRASGSSATRCKASAKDREGVSRLFARCEGAGCHMDVVDGRARCVLRMDNLTDVLE